MDGIKKFSKKRTLCFGGILTGFLNGLFGAGGGMSAVPVLKGAGLEPNSAHANSVAVIVPLSMFSATIYLLNGTVTFSDALPFIPSGVVGAAVGALLLHKIPSKWMRRIFGAFVLWAGVRLMLK